MTVLVGVRCQDGVVIGTDSAMTSTAGHQHTVQETGVIKIEIHFNEMISATTGAIGLSQRFRMQLERCLDGKELRKLQGKSPIHFATTVAEEAHKEFRKTLSPMQQHPNYGYGLGALLAFGCDEGPQLVEFDALQFHPELKGLTGEDGKQKSRPYVTMGSGQPMGDPFVAHIHRLLFKDDMPTVSEGRLLVAWTLKHVIDYHWGGVAGAKQMAVLQKGKGGWIAETVDPGEAEQAVADIEKYVSNYWAHLKGAKPPDIDAAIAAEGAIPVDPPVVEQEDRGAVARDD